MKKNTLLLLFACVLNFVNAQDLKLTNALVVSHMDKQQDRFSLEIACSEVLANAGIKNGVSLNILKQGGDPQVLLTDSITQILQAKGLNTLMLVSVRGYDKRFNKSEQAISLAEDLATDNLFPIYKEDIVSVSFEFNFYREGKLVYSDVLKIGGASSRDKVLKKFRKKLAKKVAKDWK